MVGYGQTPVLHSNAELEKYRDKFLTGKVLVVTFINPKNEIPKENENCLLKIHLIGDGNDAYITMMGMYSHKTEQWYYYDVTGRYPLNTDTCEVLGWRYLEI